MLPDYPEIKTKVFKYLKKRLMKNSMPPPLNEINKSKLYEGNRSILIRPDGFEEELTIEEISSKINEINLAEYENLNFQDIINKIDEIAQEMAKQNFKLLFNSINDAVGKTGNYINVGGELKPKHIFEILDTLQIEFEDDGSFPSSLTILLPPQLEEKAKKVMEEIFHTPELRKKYEKIINQKRSEWRARESCRKLVD
jgi:hypothetical protein